LSREYLLLVVEFSPDRHQHPQVSLVADDETIQLVSTNVGIGASQGRDGEQPAQLLLIRFPSPILVDRIPGDLVISWDTDVLRVRAAELELYGGHAYLLRRTLAGLQPALRERLVERLTALPRESAGLDLSKSLYLLREALRERMPCCVLAGDQRQGLNVESLLAIDDRAFYLRGWMWDSEADITQLYAISPEGDRIDLLPRLFAYARPDVEQFFGSEGVERSRRPGFVSYFELSAPSRLPSGWVVVMGNADGVAMEVAAPEVMRDAHREQTTILHDLAHATSANDSLIADHAYPALSRLQDRLRMNVRIERVRQYGSPPADPAVSLVVPLYRRTDFLEQQLVHFASDPEISRSDLIYVLDSPELQDQLLRTAGQLHQLHRIPFRVVILNRNGGFSVANNLGASLARGRLLLLLNSDVLPAGPGWLGRMVAFYDATPRLGALGAKLLYEDDTLQHAGMYFVPLTDREGWENLHYFKGLHRSLPAAAVPRAVPGVTGACLMVNTALYREMGGLRGMFVQGDYEDSDLCLRLIEGGYENWYLPTVELYHLEAQSYPNPLRQLTRRYNVWLHSRIWGGRIEAVMARYRASLGPAEPTRGPATG
jgi:GT2 family glycosyltransferase